MKDTDFVYPMQMRPTKRRWRGLIPTSHRGCLEWTRLYLFPLMFLAFICARPYLILFHFAFNYKRAVTVYVSATTPTQVCRTCFRFNYATSRERKGTSLYNRIYCTKKTLSDYFFVLHTITLIIWALQTDIHNSTAHKYFSNTIHKL